MLRLLDLFSGRWGWSKAFAVRGWECVGVDLVEPPEMPEGCRFAPIDVLEVKANSMKLIELPFLGAYHFDFICASSPCEQFSVHGMKHFHPNPPYPELGIKLFNHTREVCQASGVPYVMENVRAAQAFVGQAVHHCGPFYLWGSGVPPLMNQGITKGMGAMMGMLPAKLFYGKSKTEVRQLRRDLFGDGLHFTTSMKHRTATAATIPSELANCVADYAESLLDQQREALARGNG